MFISTISNQGVIGIVEEPRCPKYFKVHEGWIGPSGFVCRYPSNKNINKKNHQWSLRQRSSHEGGRQKLEKLLFIRDKSTANKTTIYKLKKAIFENIEFAIHKLLICSTLMFQNVPSHVEPWIPRLGRVQITGLRSVDVCLAFQWRTVALAVPF